MTYIVMASTVMARLLDPLLISVHYIVMASTVIARLLDPLLILVHLCKVQVKQRACRQSFDRPTDDFVDRRPVLLFDA